MAVWVIRAGRLGENEEFALANGVYGIGFNHEQSVSDFTDYKSLRDYIQKRSDDLSLQQVASQASQLWRFTHDMQVGEMVVLPRRQPRVIAVGKISGGYVFNPSDVRAPLPHTRRVEWLVSDVPRANFGQDLRNSFSSQLTVSQIRKDNAQSRIERVMNAYLGEDSPNQPFESPASAEFTDDDTFAADLEEQIDGRIIERIRQKYPRHELERLVECMLKAEGYTTLRTEPGPDGGADILAGSGRMGLDSPKLCVQVKSSVSPVGIANYNRLQGNVHGFNADYGLLVSSSGFTQPVHKENRRRFFEIRLWGPDELVEKLLDTYENLPPDIRRDIPLQKRMVLVESEDQ